MLQIYTLPSPGGMRNLGARPPLRAPDYLWGCRKRRLRGTGTRHKRAVSTLFRLLPFIATLPLKHSKVALELLRLCLLGSIQASAKPREPQFYSGDKALVWQH